MSGQGSLSITPATIRKPDEIGLRKDKYLIKKGKKENKSTNCPLHFWIQNFPYFH